MKSNKQKRAELKAKKNLRAAKRVGREEPAGGGVRVNRAALAPHNSYGEPEYVRRGYYLDAPFACAGCGKSEVWTAGQQKWWYEVAKGDPFTTARRCRSCRRTERERKAEARRVHAEGLARKGRPPA